MPAGIDEIFVQSEGTDTTDAAVLAAKKALGLAKIGAMEFDQLVWVSEGIGDYLYMDVSKTVIQKLGGRVDGTIHSYDFQRGSNGTIGFIRLVESAMLGDPTIGVSLICSALSWEHHSNHRLLGNTFLGDAAGALILARDRGQSRVLSTATASLAQFNMVTGYKYGGSINALSREAVQAGVFRFDILDYDHFQGILNEVAPLTAEMGRTALLRAGINLKQVDYVGLAGFHRHYNAQILEILCNNTRPDCVVLDSLRTTGYIGSVGVISVLEKFLNDEEVEKGATLLILAAGIDVNVESMVVRK